MRFIPLLLLISCLSRTGVELPTPEDKYKVLEEIILDSLNNLFERPLLFLNKSLLGPPLYPTPTEREFLTELLNIKDSTYLLQQFKGRRTLEPTRFKNSSIRIMNTSQLITEDFWKLINSDSIEGLYSVELPIFDETRTKCYIRTGYLCGELCGSEQDLLFRLNERTGNWEISEELGPAVY